MIFSVKLRKEKKKIHSASPTDFQAENEKDVTFRVVIYFAVIAVRSQKMCVCIFFKGFHSRTSKSNSLWQLF